MHVVDLRREKLEEARALTVFRVMYKLALVTVLVAGLFTVAARAVDRDIAALVTNPTSDLSGLSRDEITVAAQIDTQKFYQTHNDQSWERKSSEFGTAHAIKRHLLGEMVDHYNVRFHETFDALFAD
jgi:hypothetical protein